MEATMKPRVIFTTAILILSILFIIACGNTGEEPAADASSGPEPQDPTEGEQIAPEEYIRSVNYFPSWIQAWENADRQESMKPNGPSLSFDPYTWRLSPESEMEDLPPEISEDLVSKRLKEAAEDPLKSPVYPPAIVAGNLLSLSPGGQVFYVNLLSDDAGFLSMPAGGVNALGILPGEERAVISTVHGHAALFSLGEQDRRGDLLWSKEYPAAVKYLGALRVPNPFTSAEDSQGSEDSVVGTDDAGESAGESAGNSAEENTGDTTGTETRNSADEEKVDANTPSTSTLLLFLGEGGWFSLVDRDTGVEYHRSLGRGKALEGVAGSRGIAALISGDGYRSFAVTQQGTEQFAPEIVSESDINLPLAQTRSMITTGETIVFATRNLTPGNESRDSAPSYVYGYSPATATLHWVRRFSGPVVVGGGRSGLSERRETLLIADPSTQSVFEVDASDGQPLSACSLPGDMLLAHDSQLSEFLGGMLHHRNRWYYYRSANSGEDPSYSSLKTTAVTAGEVPALSRLDVDWSSHNLAIRPVDVSGEGDAGSPDFSGLSSEFSLRIRNDSLPLRLPFTPEFPVSGLLRSESRGEILITIEDERGSELLSSLDKVRLQPELRYDLRPGTYWIVLSDAGGVQDKESADSPFLVLKNTIF